MEMKEGIKKISFKQEMYETKYFYNHCTYTALLEKTNVRGVPLIERFKLLIGPV